MKSGELPLYSEDLISLIRDFTARGALMRFKAKGYSMYPFIQDGDIITVSPLKNRPSTGDIIAFIHPVTGKLHIHRIIKVLEGAFIIKGDNNDKDDGVIPEGNILGLITSIERKNQVLSQGSEKILIALLSRFKLLKLMILFRRKIKAIFRRLIYG